MIEAVVHEPLELLETAVDMGLYRDVVYRVNCQHVIPDPQSYVTVGLDMIVDMALDEEVHGWMNTDHRNTPQ